MDMHSGGGCKEAPYEKIYIEAPEEEAKIIFYNRFGHNPERVTCTCCGDDYSIGEHDSLSIATGYDRNCQAGYINENGEEVPEEQAWVRGKGTIPGVTFTYFERADTRWGKSTLTKLEDYVKQKDVLVIQSSEITPEQRIGEVPEQGYVWRD